MTTSSRRCEPLPLCETSTALETGLGLGAWSNGEFLPRQRRRWHKPGAELRSEPFLAPIVRLAAEQEQVLCRIRIGPGGTKIQGAAADVILTRRVRSSVSIPASDRLVEITLHSCLKSAACAAIRKA